MAKRGPDEMLRARDWNRREGGVQMMVALIAFKSYAARNEFNEKYAARKGSSVGVLKLSKNWNEIFRGDDADRAADVANEVAGAVVVKYGEEG